MRKIGGVMASVVMWIAIGWVGAYFFGPDGFLLIALFGLAIIGVTFKTLELIKRRRFKRVFTIISENGKPTIRFDGVPAQLAAALEIGRSNGWVAEPAPQTNTHVASIRFRPGEGAVAPQAFLEALIEANLVQHIKP